uniref:Beta-galactosidase n=1 Tax=Rhabditophanes sp. KR3021 TaxID=114890 RepID=A0AC35TTW2_9BILA
MAKWLILFFCLVAFIESKSFRVDYANGQFLLDEKPFRYISGEIHYFRVPQIYWRDRLIKYRAAGLNAVQVYIPWNWHQEGYKKEFRMDGDRNFIQLIKTAQDVGLYVLIRAGPYVCAEISNGGLPPYLNNIKNISLRTSDPIYLRELRPWWTFLMKSLYKLLYKNGGPILMIQIENEYGSFDACDLEYIKFLRDLTHQVVGKDVQLYTTDGADDRMLNCSHVDNVYSTVDFGVQGSTDNIKTYFGLQQKINKGGPKVNSEFYVGWFISWGKRNYNFPSTTSIVNTMQWMWDQGASFNVYMMAGGTSFGFYNGKIFDLSIVTTSYDFNSAITEDGDLSERYYAIKNWISTLKEWKWQPIDGMKNMTRKAYGSIVVRPVKNNIQEMVTSSTCVIDVKPVTFDEMNHFYGYVRYRTPIENVSLVSVSGIKDAGYISIDGEYKGLVDTNNMNLYVNHTGIAKFEILVEDRGRQNFETIIDIKGILNNQIVFDGEKSELWESCYLDFKRVDKHLKTLKLSTIYKESFPLKGPTLLIGHFNVDGIADTYLVLKDFHKGNVLINGHNIGRYWNDQGPQQSLFIPKNFLRQGKNKVLVFELEGIDNCSSESGCKIKFVQNSVWNWIK